MPRVAPRSRLDDLAAAATRAFGRTGYRRTRTDQVAADAGMAAGSLFNYVDSKEALFHLVFAHGFGELDADAVDLPLHAPPLDDTVALIDQGLARVVAWPNLAAALRVDDPADVRAELAAIVSDIYRTISEAWPMLAVLERCASDLPAVEAMYFGRGRRGRRRQLERYVARRVERGSFRSSTDAVVAARWLLESVTWFAWHRREDRDGALYDDERVLAGLTPLLVDALVEPTR